MLIVLAVVLDKKIDNKLYFNAHHADRTLSTALKPLINTITMKRVKTRETT